jgi:PAS domain S-box-containing protein
VTFRQSLRARALVVILVPVVVVVGNLGAALWFAHVNHQARAELQAAQQALVAAAATQSTVLSAEANGASFLLGNDPNAERRFTADLRLLPAELRQASRAVTAAGDTTTLRGAFSRLQGDVEHLDRAMAATVVTGAGVEADVVDVAALDSRLGADMAAVRAVVDRTVSHQEAVVNASGSDLVLFGVIAAAVTVLGGVGTALLFANRVVDRLRLLDAGTVALAEGRPPDPLPTGTDEVGRLGRRLADTAALVHQHQAAQQQARANLDAIMAASPLVSLRYDAVSRALVYASPNLASTMGVTVADAQADPSLLVRRLHPDDAAALDQRIATGLAGGPAGRRVEQHVRFRRHDGEAWRTARVVVTAVGDPAGTAGRNIVAYVDDVTERLQARAAADERRHLLESIFEASPDIIVVRDVTGTVVLASRQVAGLIGTTAHPGGSPGGHGHVHRNIGPEDRQRLVDLLDRCARGETTEPLVIAGIGPDGRRRVFETQARPVLADDGRVTGTVTVSRDITDRVHLEESLRQASQSAQAASTAKSEFLSRMSHELRTPLNAILGFAQLMELDALTPEQADSIDQIQRAGQHLLSLINEVLDISRIESGHLSVSVEPVGLGSVLGEVASLLAPSVDQRGIQLQVADDTPPGTHVLADRQRLLQVLLNLGSNAVKYNRPDGLVVLHGSLEADGQVRIAVTDTGPGIPPERRAELFVPFSRLGAERSGVEGTGVGLALSKHLVDLMGGTIGVLSEPGRGSTFWVTLQGAEAPVADQPGPLTDAVLTPPAARRVALAATPTVVDEDRWGAGASSRDPGTMPLVVLHVEDNESNAALVAQVLARRPGVQLLSAGLARVGLELASRHRPDLILLDLHLPDLPGDEFLHRLRADPDVRDTRVVAVSADATPTRVRQLVDLGVEAYLTKPVDVGALLRLVDMVRQDLVDTVRQDLADTVRQDLAEEHRPRPEPMP